ncbi:hypothetical protein FNF27_02713 [Cafeteria roenbergensis]|uniref:B-related factor 1 n=2 Tax=Cafeteria roenbergensis TaxID=33653 RepID=A0A5A8EIN5_CAFRO|nr:hypothetical protein FNF29_06530 [Cafeteria roenbergensis]KAA0175631.1 hypothetical protein FNF27_02713 [Cafeteria roenbergensis]|eukprot:KAA0148748.1 hypothetical protein FNF29_06530 [Cafeteria roenbergensis]
MTICDGCGTVLTENAVVSSVEFQETSGGGSAVVGQFVSGTSSKSYGGSGGYGGHAGMYGTGRESREVATDNGKRHLHTLVGKLKLGSHHVDGALRLYIMALSKNFTQGRRANVVAAACLYTVCRRERTPHMLLDFADALRVNVFTLGHTFVRFARLVNIRMPMVDPSLYIHRFAGQMELGDKKHAVATTAMRLVQIMQRDWLAAGRRPAGICGACLLVAARAHGFRRRQEDVLRIVRVADCTVRNRLAEFEAAPVARLTAEQMADEHTVQSLPPCDPPSFVRGQLETAELHRQVLADAEERQRIEDARFRVPRLPDSRAAASAAASSVPSTSDSASSSTAVVPASTSTALSVPASRAGSASEDLVTLSETEARLLRNSSILSDAEGRAMLASAEATARAVRLGLLPASAMQRHASRGPASDASGGAGSAGPKGAVGTSADPGSEEAARGPAAEAEAAGAGADVDAETEADTSAVSVDRYVLELRRRLLLQTGWAVKRTSLLGGLRKGRKRAKPDGQSAQESPTRALTRPRPHPARADGASPGVAGAAGAKAGTGRARKSRAASGAKQDDNDGDVAAEDGAGDGSEDEEDDQGGVSGEDEEDSDFDSDSDADSRLGSASRRKPRGRKRARAAVSMPGVEALVRAVNELRADEEGSVAAVHRAAASVDAAAADAAAGGKPAGGQGEKPPGAARSVTGSVATTRSRAESQRTLYESLALELAHALKGGTAGTQAHRGAHGTPAEALRALQREAGHSLTQTAPAASAEQDADEEDTHEEGGHRRATGGEPASQASADDAAGAGDAWALVPVDAQAAADAADMSERLLDPRAGVRSGAGLGPTEDVGLGSAGDPTVVERANADYSVQAEGEGPSAEEESDDGALSAIGDDETDAMLLDEAEVERRQAVWQAMHGAGLKEVERRRAASEASGGAKPRRRRRRVEGGDATADEEPEEVQEGEGAAREPAILASRKLDYSKLAAATAGFSGRHDGSDGDDGDDDDAGADSDDSANYGRRRRAGQRKRPRPADKPRSAATTVAPAAKRPASSPEEAAAMMRAALGGAKRPAASSASALGPPPKQLGVRMPSTGSAASSVSSKRRGRLPRPVAASTALRARSGGSGLLSRLGKGVTSLGTSGARAGKSSLAARPKAKAADGEGGDHADGDEEGIHTGDGTVFVFAGRPTARGGDDGEDD